MGDLNGKTVLLTGGLGTIGRAQATKLSAEGTDVIVLDRPKMEDSEKRAAALGRRVRFVGCDLNDLAQAQETVKTVAGEVGGIDILINNAALIINRPYEQFSLEEYEDQIRVNSSAAYPLVSVCAPENKQKGKGRIINFTSVTLNGEVEGYVPYVASKGALLGLTKSLARELGPYGICVNAVAPGAVVSEAETRVFGHKAEEYSAWVLDKQCLKKRIQPEDVANLVAFLASPAADMST
jgi:NAD(P)-dependent dehydrogenase (short-subunit alcohol dehydrogenase family)